MFWFPRSVFCILLTTDVSNETDPVAFHHATNFCLHYYQARFSSTTGRSSASPITTIDPLYKPLTCPRGNSDTRNKQQSHEGSFVGENQDLEKAYLRLTDYPKKEDVRPLKVLIKALAHIKNRYIQDEDFEWANEQLKSVRQDMTVQNIQNRFVIDVYETHARILLEHGDLDEFNQCQTMIRSLTEANVGDATLTKSDSILSDSMACGFEGKIPLRELLVQCPESADEFRGYAILYALVRNSSMDLKTELSRTRKIKGDNESKSRIKHDRESCCDHAMMVVRAIDENDYRTFFRLYESAPHMSAYLMDFLVKRVRDGAYERIVAAYRPNVSLEHFRECLRFDDLEETRKFLYQHGAVFVEETDCASPSRTKRPKTESTAFWVDCRASSAALT